jgi:hypothetical protein
MIDHTQLEKLIKITLLFSFSIFESFSLKYFPVFSIKEQNKLKIKCSMQNKKIFQILPPNQIYTISY